MQVLTNDPLPAFLNIAQRIGADV